MRTASDSRVRPGARERLREAVAEQGPVRQAGDAVVEGLAGQLALQADLLADVAGVQDEAADVAVVAQVGDVRLDLPPLAEAVEKAEDPAAKLPALGDVGDGLDVVGMDDLVEAARQGAPPPSGRAAR